MAQGVRVKEVVCVTTAPATADLHYTNMWRSMIVELHYVLCAECGVERDHSLAFMTGFAWTCMGLDCERRIQFCAPNQAC